MSKPWGGVGAWALDAEAAEAEERELAAANPTPTILAGEPAQSFPSLREAATAKPKKKKAVTISLAEFNTGASTGRGGGARRPDLDSRGLTPDELLRLPTGPKEHSADEPEASRLGGGFRSYGYGSGGGGGGGRRPYGGGFDDEQRRGPAPARVSEMDLPSRADEVDNWAAGKRSVAPMMDSRRSDRYASLGGSGSGFSKADEVDNWAAGKRSVAPSRYSGFGSGFRESSGSLDSDRWSRGGAGGMSMDNADRERPKLVLAPPKGDSETVTEPVRTRPSPFGAARPREEVLAEKGLDWKKVDSEIEVKKISRPTSSQSSRPESPGSQVTASAMGEGGGKPRQKVNPFGDARPREVLLEEQGTDWRRIDLELERRRIDRPETEEEKLLKEEIYHLKNALTKESEGNQNGDSAQDSVEQLASIREQILQREKELDKLIQELDSKVRFSLRAPGDMRPGSGSGSGSGRVAVSSERLPEGSRSTEFGDRPHSRGSTGDSWGRMDERRGIQGDRDMGVIGSRNIDNRSRSRERW